MTRPVSGIHMLRYLLPALCVAVLTPAAAHASWRSEIPDSAGKPAYRLETERDTSRASAGAATVVPMAVDDDVPGVALPPSPFSDTLSSSADIDDVFYIDLQANDWLMLEMQGPAKSSFYVYGWGPDTTTVVPSTPGYDEANLIGLSDWGFYPEMLVFRAPKAGRYYIDVYAQMGTGTYTVTWETWEGEADDDIPGVPIPASPVKGSFEPDKGGSDVYAVQLAEGDVFTADLSGPADGDLDMMFYTSEALTTMGSVPPRIFCWGWTSEEHLTFVVPPGGAGTYYLEVLDFGFGGEYTLSWRISDLAAPRVFGASRYETAIAISRASFLKAESVVIATGTNYPDALSAAGLAGVLDCPVLLVPRSESGYDTVDMLMEELLGLQTEKVYIVGGTGAVDEFWEDMFYVDDTSSAVERIAGPDRYGTSRAVADKMVALGAAPDTAFVVCGTGFADALAVSPYAFAQQIPILLTRPNALPDSAKQFIEAHGVDQVVIAGGTGVVSSGVEGAIAGLRSGAVEVHREGGTDRYSTAAMVARYCIDTSGWGAWNQIGVATGMNFPDALAGGPGCGVRQGGLLLTQRTLLPDASRNQISGHASTLSRTLIFGGTGAVSDWVRSDIVEAMKE